MYEWSTCSVETKAFVRKASDCFRQFIPETIGVYLHGSLAMGGFQPEASDVDLLVVSKNVLTKPRKNELARACMELSGHPHPLEVHVLSKQQLEQWKHPSPFEFHYSESWRERFEQGVYTIEDDRLDGDLTAHLVIIKKRGICLFGESIEKLFPIILEKEYLSSILSDYSDCLKIIQIQPVYAVLNLLRVYWFVLDGTISSKQEAGEWGVVSLPALYHKTIKKALLRQSVQDFDQGELMAFSVWIKRRMKAFVKENDRRAD